MPLLVALCALGCLVAPAVARAGSYQVRSCFPGTPNRSWYGVQPNGHVAAYDACGSFFEGFVSRNSLQPRGVNDPAHFFEDARMQIDAPAGTFFTGLHGDITSGETWSNGFGAWRSGIQDEGGWMECGSAFPCRYDSTNYVPRDYTGRHTRYFQIETICAAVNGCARDQQYARTRMRNVTVDVEDDAPPAAVSPRGVYGVEGWVSGGTPIGFDAVDNTGIQRMRAEVDPGGAHGFGWPVDAAFGCDYSVLVPCANQSVDTWFDTTAMGDGTHVLRLCAEDAAQNWGCLGDAWLRIDNTPVGKVQGSALQGDTGWRPQNGFVINYTQPATEVDGGEHAPIARRHVEVCRADGSECSVDDVAGSASSVVVDVPAPGEWKARVWEEDAAGHDAAAVGNQGDWVTLRYDPTAPGAAEPQHRNGWTNATDLPDYKVRLGARAAVGPSGIRGYAVSTNGARPGVGPNTVANDDGSRTFPAPYPLHALAEGVTLVTARAISGSGLPAGDSDIGASEVRVDRTVPAVSLSSDASGDEWERRPVEVTLSASDQAELSGLDHLEYQVDSGTAQRVDLSGASEDDVLPADTAGPSDGSASVTLTADGTHTVTARAVDEAGNASESRSLTVKIDATGPAGGFEPPDPADPTKVSVYVADSCIRAATVQLRRPGGEWTALPTQIGEVRVTAHVPDDVYRGGNYELRAVVTDCAGNTSILDRWWGGASSGRTVVITLPLRLKTVVRASLDPTPLVRVCSSPRKAKPHRKPVPRTCRKRRAPARPAKSRGVTGTVKTLDGKPVANVAVSLEVQRKGLTTWRTVTTKRTNAKGTVRAAAPAGPSRAVRLVYAGSPRLYGAGSGLLRFKVPASSTITLDRRKLRNGHTVRISGRLLGGFVPRGGREVELDGLNPLKKRWQPVQTRGLRTKSNGQWSARYRFTATRGRVTYQFRLRIAPTWGYPFEEGFSKVVRVTVVG